jgi:hypothetical protein
MEDRLDLPLQPLGHHCLRDPIGHGRYAQNSDPIAVRLGYLHGQHRRRKVTAGRHSIPDLVQLIAQIGLELLQRAPIHPGGTLVRLHLLPGVLHLPLRNLKRLA